MSTFYQVKLSPKPPVASLKDYPGKLPATFKLQSYAHVNPQLTLYQGFDETRAKPARLWLEKFSPWPEQHWQRAAALRALAHPNLLPVYDHYLSPDGQFYTMAVEIPDDTFVPLRQLLAGAMNPGLAGRIIRQVALALDYCHSQGMLHLNLQPNFIWLGREGAVRVEPFAARLETVEAARLFIQPDLPEPSIRLIPYLSPERFRIEMLPDKRADVYALGLLAYELLSGFNPFWSDDNASIQILIEHKTVKPLGELNAGVSPRLEQVVAQAMHQHPSYRFGSVLEFLAHFEAALHTSTDTTTGGWAENLMTDYQQVAYAAFNFAKSVATAGELSPPRVELPERTVSPAAPFEPTTALAVSQPPITTESSLAIELREPAPLVPIVAEPARPFWRRWARLVRRLLVLNILVMLVILWLLGSTGPLGVNGLLLPTQPPTLSPTPAQPAIKLPAVTGPGTQADESGPATSPLATPAGLDRWQNSLAEARRLIFQAGEVDNGLKIYVSITARDDGYEPAYRELGEALYWVNHSDTGLNAVDTLKRAVALDPNDARAWAYLALAYQDLYQYDKGLAAVLQAYKLNPKLPETLAAQALLLSRTDEDGQANSVLNDAKALDNQNLLVQWAQVALLRKENQWLQANGIADQLMLAYPGLVVLKNNKADLLRSEGTAKYPEALSWYKQVIGADARFAYAYTGLAYIYYAQGKYDLAETNFNQALALQPAYAHNLTGLGYLRLVQRRYAEAQDDFKRSIKSDPREAEAYNGLAATYLSQGDFQQVGEWADLALKYAPRYADPYFNKGSARYALKDYAGAVESLEQSVKLAPSNGQYYEALAFAYYSNGNIEAARQAAQEGLRLKPQTRLEELLKLLSK